MPWSAGCCGASRTIVSVRSRCHISRRGDFPTPAGLLAPSGESEELVPVAGGPGFRADGHAEPGSARAASCCACAGHCRYGGSRAVQSAVRKQMPCTCRAQPCAGQVAGQTANTSPNIRARGPRCCYPYCMISPIRGDLTGFRVQVPLGHTSHGVDLRFFVSWHGQDEQHRCSQAWGFETPSDTSD